jgi:PAS domain S-box-containing protein
VTVSGAGTASLQEVLDALPLAVVVADDHLRITGWNAAATVLYGHGHEAAVGQDIPTLLFDVDDRVAARSLLDGLRAGESWEGDQRIRRRDGVLLVSSFRGVPLGEGVAWIATDGMDQGLAEQERGILLSAEHAARNMAEEALGLVEAIVTSAPIGIAVFDLDLRCVRVNQAFADLSGVAPDEHLGRGIDDVLRLPSEFGADLRRVVTTGRTILGRPIELTDEGRSARHFTVSYYPVRTTTGSLVGAGATLVEVTEARLAEAERAALLLRAEEAQAQLSVLATASTVLTSTMDVDELLGRLARVLTPNVADWCVIQLFTGGAVEHVSVSHRDRSAARDLEAFLRTNPMFEAGEGPVAAALRSGQAALLGPEVIADALARAAHDRRQPALATRYPLRTSVVVPIGTRSQTLGVLLLSTEGLPARAQDRRDPPARHAPRHGAGGRRARADGAVPRRHRRRLRRWRLVRRHRVRRLGDRRRDRRRGRPRHRRQHDDGPGSQRAPRLRLRGA